MKAIVALLLLVSYVGYSHTDEEKRRYVDAILTRTANVASFDNWPSEGCNPDPNNVLTSWEGFLGRPGGSSWAGGWSIAERRAAFNWYLGTLATTNSLAFSANDKYNVFTAFATCKRFSYTNAVPLLRRAALNPNCVHRARAIEYGVGLGDVGPASTEFVETIVTNVVGYTREERIIARGRYASKVLAMCPVDSQGVTARNAAVRNLYKNRFVGGVICASILDTLFVAKIEGYEYSSNRLENARYVLASPECHPRARKKYIAITNQLLSSSQPLRQLNIDAEGGE